MFGQDLATIILWWFFLFGAAFYLFSSVYYSTKALQLRQFKSYPNPDDIVRKFEDHEVETFYQSLAEYFRQLWPENESVVGNKSKALDSAMRGTKYGLILLVVFLTISVGSYLSKRPHITKEVSSVEQTTEKPTTEPQPEPQPQSEKPEVVPLNPTTVERDAPTRQEK